jgi:cytochrome c biogenesis protein CcdA
LKFVWDLVLGIYLEGRKMILDSFAFTDPKTMLPLVALTGFLDGIHPCAIAILIFFIAFLLTLKRSYRDIFKLGMVYITVIYLTYLAIGVGLLSGIMIFGQHHFFAKLGAALLILMGVGSLKSYFFPQFKLRVKFPKPSHARIRQFLETATLPGVAIAAFLVGLCSVPCSGGIYAAITALLASRTTFWIGFAYLAFYNLFFVLPLLIILLLSSNPYVLVKIGEWQQKSRKNISLGLGIFMIALGIAILAFLV